MNTLAMIFGYLCLTIIFGFVCRPVLRGVSAGLFETVLYYKAGCSYKTVLKQFLASFTTYPFRWIFRGKSCESFSIGGSGWWGIFNWSFDKSLNRKSSKNKESTK